MTGVLLSDRYLSPMTDADLDEVVAIEQVAYEFRGAAATSRIRCATVISACVCGT